MKQYKLKDITELITCGVAKRPEYTKEGIMFLSSQNVKADKIILDKYNYISIYDYERLTKINKPEKGDILYTRVGSFGEAAVVDIDDKFALYVSLTLIKPKKELVNNRYLMHFLNSPKVKEFAKNNTRGIGVQNLNVDTVREFDIVIPSLNTQKKIVECLDKAQKLIDKRKEQIEALDELVKSQFIEMFGNIITNSKNWETVKLKDICLLKSGGTPTRSKPEYFQGDIPWITTVALGKNFINENDAIEYITQEAISNSATKLIKENSLLFGMRVGVGKTSINTVPMCTNQDIMAITEIDTTKYDLIFLKKIIESYSEYFNNQKRGATIQGIKSDTLKEIEIPIISSEAQNQFADFVKQVDKLKSEMEKSLKELEDNFNSLMQKAFKGELFN